MSKIYIVRRKSDGEVLRYVRAKTLVGAVRAHAEELFEAKPATTEEVYQATRAGTLKVLNAVKEPVPVEYGIGGAA